MRGRNPSAAPGLEDGRGRAALGEPSFAFAGLSIFELSCDKSSCEARPVASRRLGEHEVGEVREDPVVLQGVVDHAQELLGQGDDRLAGPAAGLDLVVELRQVGAVAHGNQGALHQGRPRQFRPAFGNPPGAFGLVAVADPGHDAEVGRQLPGMGEVVDVADHRQHHGRPQVADALDAPQVLVAGQFRPLGLDGLLQLGDARVAGTDLAHDHPQFGHHDGVEFHRQHLVQAGIAGQGFLPQVDPMRRKDVVHLVLQGRPLLDQRVAGLRETGQLGVQLVFHTHLRQHVLRQVKGQRPGVVRVGLLHRVADHAKLGRVDHHDLRHVRGHGVVKQPRVSRHLHRHFVRRPELGHESGQVLQAILTEVLPSVLGNHTHRELIPMQIHSNVTSHVVVPPQGLMKNRGGVDVLCGSHQTPMRGHLSGLMVALRPQV